MKVVKVRSPFIIEVNEAGAIGSKVELYIYPYGSSLPATPTYTLSKSNPSTTQLSTIYNVSNYVKEYIDNIKATYTNYIGAVEQNNEWVVFQVKRYKLVGTTYTLLNTIDYVGVNGFTEYTSGNQNPSDSVVNLLFNNNINNYYYKQTTYPNDKIQYFNLLIDKPTATTTTVNVKYERIDGTIKVNDVVDCAEKVYKFIKEKYPNTDVTKVILNNCGPNQYRKMKVNHRDEVIEELMSRGLIEVIDVGKAKVIRLTKQSGLL